MDRFYICNVHFFDCCGQSTSESQYYNTNFMELYKYIGSVIGSMINVSTQMVYNIWEVSRNVDDYYCLIENNKDGLDTAVCYAESGCEDFVLVSSGRNGKLMNNALMKDGISYNSYKIDFDNKWSHIIEEINKVIQEDCVCLNGHIWLTDCGDNDDMWAEWFYNQSFSIEKTFLCIDFTSNYFDKASNEIVKKFFGNAYDNNDKEDAFWRFDYVTEENYKEIITKIKYVDSLLYSLQTLSARLIKK